jgi:hypothetical protein
MALIEENESAKASVPRHFRIQRDVYDSLEEEAKKLEVSLNWLVNRVLSNHTRDDWILDSMGLVKMPDEVFREFVSLIPEDKMRELGSRVASTILPSMMLEMDGTVNLGAVLNSLQLMSRGGAFVVHESHKNGRRRISLTHRNGPKLSAYYSGLVPTLFAQAGVTVKIKTTSDSITFEY